ncbi:hypothetical protein EDC04DRAFT_2779251 [Pisolithus marmoratus]|nr:hypothetical protein EDC04DRAFT_2779251 [Pisolithus marmoratus]
MTCPPPFTCKQLDRDKIGINCHATTMKPAPKILRAMREFMMAMVFGREPPSRLCQRRGQQPVEYKQKGRRLSLTCPE